MKTKHLIMIRQLFTKPTDVNKEIFYCIPQWHLRASPDLVSLSAVLNWIVYCKISTYCFYKYPSIHPFVFYKNNSCNHQVVCKHNSAHYMTQISTPNHLLPLLFCRCSNNFTLCLPLLQFYWSIRVNSNVTQLPAVILLGIIWDIWHYVHPCIAALTENDQLL